MRRNWMIYIGFFTILLAGFYYFLFRNTDFSRSMLPVINNNIPDFSFTDQNGRPVTERDIEGKVYVVEFFFTSCRGICPLINANMRRVYDRYKDDSGFCILSHSSMPETDSVPLLKAYENWMLNGKILKSADGSYKIIPPTDGEIKPIPAHSNWYFLTGDKVSLYQMARAGYMIDNNKTDTAQKISDQFIHTQFFALVDKQRCVRGIYDGLKNDEVEKLLGDIKGLLREKLPKASFKDGFNNAPN